MLPKVTITLAVAFPAISAAAATINKRIISGEDAKEGEFPSMDNTKGGEYSGIRGTIMHPGYHSNGLYVLNDIGLVLLKEGFDESETIGYASLPANGSDPKVKSEAIALGWGRQDYKDFDIPTKSSDKLSKVVLPIRPRQDCWNRILDVGKTGADTIVCAGGNGKNVCREDSGGPLIDQKGQVIGIASTVIKDEGGNFCNLEPSLFTRVSSYLAWINENIEKEPSSSGPTREQTGVAVPSPTKAVPTSVPTVSNFPETLEGIIKQFCDKHGLGSDDSCLPVGKYCLWNGKFDGYASMEACVDAFKEAGLLDQTDVTVPSSTRAALASYTDG
ncbi:hypothetical protein MY11210_002417 [Beauveria gryllotalpidicola]